MQSTADNLKFKLKVIFKLFVMQSAHTVLYTNLQIYPCHRDPTKMYIYIYNEIIYLTHLSCPS